MSPEGQAGEAEEAEEAEEVEEVEEAEEAEDLLDTALDVLQGTPEPSDAQLQQEAAGDVAQDDRPLEAAEAASGAPDALRSYLQEIARIALLSASQEVSFGVRIQAGLQARAQLHAAGEAGQPLEAEAEQRLRRAVIDGRTAAADMTEANLRLVVSVAKRYIASGVPLLDLIQEGNLGLMKAVERFDPHRGFKFSTYATWWIRQACSRGVVMSSRLVRVPSDVHWQLQSLRRTEREMAEALGRAPYDAELATRLGIPTRRVVELRQLPPDPVSLDMPLGADGEGTLQEILVDDEAIPLADQVVAAQLRPAMQRVLDTLPERDRRIVELRSGLVDGRTHTYEEIARELGVSRERIRQVEGRVFARLRHHPDIAGLRDTQD
jgi:RNA polymerase primary sigma factor